MTNKPSIKEKDVLERFRKALTKLNTYIIMIPVKDSKDSHTLRGYDADDVDNLLNVIIDGITVKNDSL